MIDIRKYVFRGHLLCSNEAGFSITPTVNLEKFDAAMEKMKSSIGELNKVNKGRGLDGILGAVDKLSNADLSNLDTTVGRLVENLSSACKSVEKLEALIKETQKIKDDVPSPLNNIDNQVKETQKVFRITEEGIKRINFVAGTGIAEYVEYLRKADKFITDKYTRSIYSEDYYPESFKKIIEDNGKHSPEEYVKYIKKMSLGYADLYDAANKYLSVHTKINSWRSGVFDSSFGDKFLESIRNVSPALRAMNEQFSSLKQNMSATDWNNSFQRALNLPQETIQDVIFKLNRLKELQKEALTNTGGQQSEVTMRSLSNAIETLTRQKQNMLITDTKIVEMQNKIAETFSKMRNDNLIKQSNALIEQTKQLTGANSSNIDSYVSKLQNAYNKINREAEKYKVNLRDMKKEYNALANSGKLNLADPTTLQRMQELQRNIKSAQSSAESLTGTSRKLKQELDRINSGGIYNLQSQVHSLNQGLRTTNRLFEQLKGRIAMAFSIYTVESFLKGILQIRGELELQKRSLDVLMSSKVAADELYQKTVALAVKSPFQITQLVDYTKRLKAYKIEEEELYDTTKRLADISAGLGVDMQRLILAYGQVKAANYLRGQELRQFSEAGVNILDELAQYFNQMNGTALKAGDVFEMVSKRMVKFEDVKAVFEKLTNAGGVFYRMQEEQADTLKGRISNLKDRFAVMFDEIGRANDSSIKGGIDIVVDLMNHWKLLAEVIKDFGIVYLSVIAKNVMMNGVLGKENAMLLRNANAKSRLIKANNEAAASYMKSSFAGSNYNAIIKNNNTLLEENVSKTYKDLLAKGDLTATQKLLILITNRHNKALLDEAVALGVIDRKMATTIAGMKGFKAALQIVNLQVRSLYASMKVFLASNWIFLVIGAVARLAMGIKNAAESKKELNKEFSDIQIESTADVDKLIKSVRNLDKAYNDLLTTTRTIKDEKGISSIDLSKQIDENGATAKELKDRIKAQVEALNEEFEKIGVKNAINFDPDDSLEEQVAKLNAASATLKKVNDAYLILYESVNKKRKLKQFEELNQSSIKVFSLYTTEIENMKSVFDKIDFGEKYKKEIENLQAMPTESVKEIKEFIKAYKDLSSTIQKNDITKFNYLHDFETKNGIFKFLQEYNKLSFDFDKNSKLFNKMFESLNVKEEDFNNPERVKIIQGAFNKLFEQIGVQGKGAEFARELVNDISKELYNHTIYVNVKTNIIEDDGLTRLQKTIRDKFDKEGIVFTNDDLQKINSYVDLVDVLNKKYKEYSESLDKVKNVSDKVVMQGMGPAALPKQDKSILGSTDYPFINFEETSEYDKLYSLEKENSLYEQQLDVIKAIAGAFNVVLDSQKKASKAANTESIWNQKIKLIKDAHEQYKKYLDYYEKETALEKATEQFRGAFKEAGLNITDYLFDNSNFEESLRKLTSNAPDKVKREVERFFADLKINIDLKNAELDLESLKSNFERQINNYNFSKKMSDLGVGSDFWEGVFNGYKNVNFDDLIDLFNTEFIDQMKAAGVSDYISLASIDINEFKKNLQIQEEGTIKKFEAAYDLAKKLVDMANSLKESMLSTETGIYKKYNIDVQKQEIESKYLTYQNFIKEQYKNNEELRDMHLKSLDEWYDAELALINDKSLQETQLYRKLFGDLSTYSDKSLKMLSDNLKDMLDSAKIIGGNKVHLSYTDIFGDGEEKELNISIGQYTQLIKQLNTINKQRFNGLPLLKNTFISMGNLSEAEKEYLSILNDENKAQEHYQEKLEFSLNNLKKAKGEFANSLISDINGIITSFEFLNDILGESGNIAKESLEAVVSVASGMATAISSAEKSSVILAIIQAAIIAINLTVKMIDYNSQQVIKRTEELYKSYERINNLRKRFSLENINDDYHLSLLSREVELRKANIEYTIKQLRLQEESLAKVNLDDKLPISILTPFTTGLGLINGELTQSIRLTSIIVDFLSGNIFGISNLLDYVKVKNFNYEVERLNIQLEYMQRVTAALNSNMNNMWKYAETQIAKVDEEAKIILKTIEDYNNNTKDFKKDSAFFEDQQKRWDDYYEKLEESALYYVTLIKDTYGDLARDMSNSFIKEFDKIRDHSISTAEAFKESWQEAFKSFVANMIKTQMLDNSLTGLMEQVYRSMGLTYKDGKWVQTSSTDYWIDPNEANELKQYIESSLKPIYEGAYEAYDTILGALGIASSAADSALKGSVSSLSEQTGNALEALLNTMRYRMFSLYDSIQPNIEIMFTNIASISEQIMSINISIQQTNSLLTIMQEMMSSIIFQNADGNNVIRVQF